VGYERSGYQRVDAQDTRYAVMSALYIYTELIAGFQIGIRGGARPFQLRGGSIKQNENFENSQDLKGRSENCKTP
jgi:hypothetical protein